MRWNWGACICIIPLVILLKNALSLSILAKYNKYGVLIGTMWNVINLNSLLKITDLMNEVPPISNIKLADLVVFLLK